MCANSLSIILKMVLNHSVSASLIEIIIIISKITTSKYNHYRSSITRKLSEINVLLIRPPKI